MPLVLLSILFAMWACLWAGTHYIALAVKPAEDSGDSGDFHFWRLDDNKVWSYKVSICCLAVGQAKTAAARRGLRSLSKKSVMGKAQ